MNNKTDIFFDLDNTLWDFEANAKAALAILFDKYNLAAFLHTSREEFIKAYRAVSHQLWAKVNTNEISLMEIKYSKLKLTFEVFGKTLATDPMAFEDEYVELCSLGKILMPNAAEILAYLSPKYNLHIITNGFENGTALKMQHELFQKYIKTVTNSEEVGAAKPNPAIFEYALAKAKVEKENAIMIGDNLIADIQGARAFGLDCIFFDIYEEKALPNVPIIKDLSDLKNLL